jgi:ketosteroid isomerase-like protein
MIRSARGSDYENKLPAPADPDAAGLVLFLTMQSVYALRDGDVEGHVEAYADDATLVWPTGNERGKEALRRRARSQSWNGVDRRHIQPGEIYVRQEGPDSFLVTGTYSYWDGKTQLNISATTRWKARSGIWQITHQQLGEARPVFPADSIGAQPTQ